MPAWAVMWTLSFAIYCVLKFLAFYARTTTPNSTWRNLGFLFAWPGMDADAFLTPTNGVLSPALSEWCFAATKLSIGLGLLIGVVPWMSNLDCYWMGCFGMIGIVMSLHFGLFHLLSCWWRGRGICAMPIMNWPIKSVSLAEFWGRRWNLAFRDLTHRFLFRPLYRRIGSTGALLTGFVVSGLIHDLVISVPANGGYGQPTIYFTLQGVGIVIEKSSLGQACGLGRGLIGRVFCASILLIPCGLLLHRPFACGVIVPFLQAIGVVK